MRTYIRNTGLNIDSCPDQEIGPVTILYIFSDDINELLNFPLTHALLDSGKLKKLNDRKFFIETKFNELSGSKYTVFSTVIYTLRDTTEVSDQFKRLVLLAILNDVSFNKLLYYDYKFVSIFIRSYYSIEHTLGLVNEDAIPLISNKMFKQLSDR